MEYFESENENKKSKPGIELSRPVVILSVLAGLCVILFIGLMCGLVARPNNCIKQNSTSVISTLSTLSTNSQSTTTIPTTTSVSATSSTSTTVNTPVTASNRTIPSPSTLSSTVTETTITEFLQFRLLNSVIPIKYDLLLKTYFNAYSKKTYKPKTEQLEYSGEVSILIDVKSSTNRILLHIDRVIMVGGSDVSIQNENTAENIEIDYHRYLPNQLYEILTINNLAVNQYKLIIRFKSQTSTGFYRADYIEEGYLKTLLATSFMPIQARTAFPCFDEPSFKAKFEITIEHPIDSFALSNFPVQINETFTESKTTRRRTKFLETYKMSTYLVGWAILPDDFQYMNLGLSKPQIRVYARKLAYKEGLASFAYEVAQKSISYYSNFFNITEALPPKIDLLALPDYPDKSSPNWGLNGFHEDNLLYNNKFNSRIDKQNVALMIAKELAHYWFGNYVTSQWWDDLWLNEALATFFKYKCIHYNYNSYDVKDQFLSDILIPVMWEDGFVSSRPLKINVNSLQELDMVFDDLTYSKGASIMRMLESAIGEKEFQIDLINYLKSNPYGSVTVEDFYKSINLQSVTELSTKSFLEPYILQKNYPEVAVILKTVGDKTRVEFKQARFLLSEIQEEGSSDLNSPFNYTWNIYLQCKAGGIYDLTNNKTQHLEGANKDFNFFLESETGHFDLDRIYTWVKCNKDFNSYYITDYDNTLFDAFNVILINKPTTFSIGDRTNLIHVAFELAFLGSHSYYIANLLTNYFESYESALTPFKTFFWHINKIANIIEHRTSFKGLREFIIELMNEVVIRLKLDIWFDPGDSNHQETLLKTNIVEFLCRMQSNECLNKATDLFNSIPPEYFIEQTDPRYNNTPLVYKYHMQNTYDYSEWLRLLTFYKKTNIVREREYALEALANTRSTWLIDLYLENVFDENFDGIKEEDEYDVIASVGKNPSGRYLAWYYLREFWLYYVIRFGQTRKLTNTMRIITESFDNYLLLEEIQQFFASTIDFENMDIRKKIFDIVLNNIYWVVDKEEEFSEFFSEFKKKI